MQAAKQIVHCGQTLWLSTERVIFWEEKQALILSDLHFGKTGHFRKAGIGVPQNVYREDLQRLVTLVQQFRPAQLIVVGDMFHSVANKELELFMRWRNDFPHLHIHLVKGNHDVLPKTWYSAANIVVHDDHLAVANFCFVHDISAVCTNDEINYYFSGHIHPCVGLKGLGRQKIKLPCYYFGKEFAVLPAFGRFTGTALIQHNSHDQVYAILPADSTKQQHASIMQVN